MPRRVRSSLRWLVWLVALVGGGLAPPIAEAQPQSERRLPAVRCTVPPVIDGDLSDPAWQEAPVATGFADEFSGATDIDPTEARLCYDDAAIYVAFRCHDSQPDAIVAREIRRNAEFQGEDTVTFILDPYLARRGDDMNWFTVNALGTGSAELAGGRARKVEWEGVWTSAARRTETGWEAELRIPWAMLSYPARSPLTMGINFMRRQERTRLRSHWSFLGYRYRWEQSGLWEGVEPPRAAFRPTLSLLPYASPGYLWDRGRRLRAGLDARLTLTPELTGVATLNPDFASVEGAVEGIEFSRGERFVPETRPFFLEGAEYLEANMFGAGRSGWGRPFFARRVPQFDAGVKFYGRLADRYSLGFLGAVDLGNRSDWVARVTRDVGPNSYVGAYAVQRWLPGDENLVLGIDEYIRRGFWVLRGDFARSLGDDAGGAAAYASLRWETDRLRFLAGYTYVAPDFRAANGFIPFLDFRGWNGEIRYTREWREGPLQRVFLELEGMSHERTDGRFFRRNLEADAFLVLRDDTAIRLAWEGGRFEDEHDNEFSIGFTRNYTNRFRRWGVSYSFGKRADEPISFLQPQFSFRVFGSWDIAFAGSILDHVEDRQQFILTINREIDPIRALGGRLIVADGRVTYFVSYRVSGGRGMETYFLFGDPDPNRRRMRQQLLTKFVWPF